MIVKKYTAATETDAVLKAREELGSGAVVLNVKTVKQRGIARLFKKDFVEITAALDEKESQTAAPQAPVQEARSFIMGTNERRDYSVSGPFTEASIEKKLDTLQNLLADQIKKNEDDRIRAEKTAEDTKESGTAAENKENGNIKYLRMIYNKLIESEVDEKVANMIIEDIDTSLKKESNIDNIISAIYQKIILKLGEPEAVNTDNGRTAVFFLGPTGVGKTTTIAKLASDFKLNKGLKVALITADTYRIAAVEQLNTYAGILDVPVSVIFTPEELVEAFDYHHMSKSPAVFDTVKLKWMNGEYLKAMDFDKFYALAEPYLKEAVTKDYDLKKIAALVKTRIEILPEIKEQVDFFEELPDYDIALYTHKKMKTDAEKSLALLNEVLPVLEAQDDFSNDALFETLKAFATEKGYKVGYVMWPLRTAVSGKQNTPGGATELMEVLGKDESLRRIRLGIEKLQ